MIKACLQDNCKKHFVQEKEYSKQKMGQSTWAISKMIFHMVQVSFITLILKNMKGSLNKERNVETDIIIIKMVINIMDILLMINDREKELFIF